VRKKKSGGGQSHLILSFELFVKKHSSSSELYQARTIARQRDVWYAA
jgi:hypothetical protein